MFSSAEEPLKIKGYWKKGFRWGLIILNSDQLRPYTGTKLRPQNLVVS